MRCSAGSLGPWQTALLIPRTISAGFAEEGAEAHSEKVACDGRADTNDVTLTPEAGTSLHPAALARKVAHLPGLGFTILRTPLYVESGPFQSCWAGISCRPGSMLSIPGPSHTGCACVFRQGPGGLGHLV